MTATSSWVEEADRATGSAALPTPGGTSHAPPAATVETGVVAAVVLDRVGALAPGRHRRPNRLRRLPVLGQATIGGRRPDDDTDVGTRVVSRTPHGPVFSGRRAPRRRVGLDTFVPLDRRTRLQLATLTAGWACCFVLFWAWWLLPAHRVTWTGFILNSALLLYLSTLPFYFLAAVNRLRTVNTRLELPPLRVAFVVTRAPSEPWPVARTTLEAMSAQDYPYAYDVWLCDENPTPEILEWCRNTSVQVSNRYGVTEYHRADWPRRTKCKEGNLAYFYDLIGYEAYDIVAQLDCDHVPTPTYLAEITRPFADPAIGYVAAPSMCDSNESSSWAARGRLHKEGTFHGPFQLGHHDGYAPLCIGSHYAVRTAALRQIGGIGPELAEDFSTTFLLNSAGWDGAFADRAEAHGDGPQTVAALLTQEFQWSRSLVTLLLDMLPMHLRRFHRRLRVRFLFTLTYYPLLVVASIAGVILPPFAAITGVPWIRVGYIDFTIRWFCVSVWILAITLLVRRRGLLRPRGAPILSWENWLYTVVRWPFIAWGVFAAMAQKIRPRPVGFKVTPKGQSGLETLPARLTAPLAVVSAELSLAAWLSESLRHPSGYVLLSILGATVYAVAGLAVTGLHAAEAARSAGVRWRTAVSATVRVPGLVAVAVLAPLVVAISFSWPTVQFVLRIGPGPAAPAQQVGPLAGPPSADPDLQAAPAPAPSRTSRPSPTISAVPRQLLPTARVTVLAGGDGS